MTAIPNWTSTLLIEDVYFLSLTLLMNILEKNFDLEQRYALAQEFRIEPKKRIVVHSSLLSCFFHSLFSPTVSGYLSVDNNLNWAFFALKVFIKISSVCYEAVDRPIKKHGGEDILRTFVWHLDNGITIYRNYKLFIYINVFFSYAFIEAPETLRVHIIARAFYQRAYEAWWLEEYNTPWLTNVHGISPYQKKWNMKKGFNTQRNIKTVYP